MRANAWRQYLEEQRDRYAKVLFTPPELDIGAKLDETGRATDTVSQLGCPIFDCQGAHLVVIAIPGG